MGQVDLLVIGGSGFVGGQVLQAAQQKGLQAAYTWAHNPRDFGFPSYRVDLEQEDDALAACLKEIRPRSVVYCAVPGVGADDTAHEWVSVRSVERMLGMLDPGTRLVYVSTNAVFSGWKGPYRESDPAEERTDRYRAYGVMRARGEQVVLTGWENALVARTAHVEGCFADGPLHWRLGEVVERLKAGQEVPRFTDRSISPTWVNHLAEGLLETAAPGFSRRGILNLAGSQVLTDYDYTRLVARAIGVNDEQVRPDRMLQEGHAGSYNLALDTTLAQRLLSTRFARIEVWLAALFGKA
jgi:dTDP-4-dehydrorhamnose reductase